MTFFADLAPLPYFGPMGSDALRAVGWLDGAQGFPVGETERRHLDRLVELLQDAWQPFTCGGRHTCNLCQFSGGPRDFVHGPVSIPIGLTNLFLPTGTCVLVAPSTVLHYIDAHRYRPPEEFLTALYAFEGTTHSMAYKKLLLASGGRGLGKLPAR